MFFGGGVGGIWNTAQETEWFYNGYGRTEIDLVALSYFRYERIVVDIADRAERIFGLQGSVDERRNGLRLAEQFQPNNVVDIAHQTYQQLG
jgi:spectinomycin phosphotransferase